VLVAGCILTVEQSKTIFKTIGYSVGVLAIVALVLRGHDNTGRLGLLNTRYENANDFAWTLILGLSFLTFFLLRGNRREKLIALFLSAPILLALVKTGSRGGMIGLGMLAFVGYFQASRALKTKLALGIPVLLALLVAATPGDIRSRYTTFLSAGGKTTQLEATAIGSSEARLQVLKDSIYETFTHPVFGVGPGDFAVAQNTLALARGESRGLWLVTHNTYTQISSEMGFPGLIIYLVFLYQCFKPLNSIVRSRYSGKDWQDLRALAKSLRASFFIIVTIAVFDAYGYDINIPIMAGLSCALALIAERQRARLEAPPQVSHPPLVFAPEPDLQPNWMSFQ
jgi:O-antigen ligase